MCQNTITVYRCDPHMSQTYIAYCWGRSEATGPCRQYHDGDSDEIVVQYCCSDLCCDRAARTFQTRYEDERAHYFRNIIVRPRNDADRRHNQTWEQWLQQAANRLRVARQSHATCAAARARDNVSRSRPSSGESSMASSRSSSSSARDRFVQHR